MLRCFWIYCFRTKKISDDPKVNELLKQRLRRIDPI